MPGGGSPRLDGLSTAIAAGMTENAKTSGRVLGFPFSPAEEEAAARALAGGAVMAYPTETSYALGGNALHEGLAAEIFRLKGRGAHKALLLLIDPAAHLAAFTQSVPPAARRLMEAFWPGPLTLVFRAGAGLPAHLADRRGTVALRCSPHPVVERLLRIGGVPLIGTSANPSGGPPARGVEDLLAAFGHAVALAVDGGRSPGGLPSTVLDTTTRPFILLREGAVSHDALCAALRDDFADFVPAAR